MEADKDRRMIYSLLLEEKLEAFFLSLRTQLHVYKVEDLMHVTRKDLSSIGLLSGPDVRRFEKVIGKVAKNTGLKGIFTKVLPKKQKQLIEIPATVTLWEEFEPVIIKSEDLVLKEILGTGNFGQVYQAEWIRRSGGNEMKIDVAVKCLKEESNESFIKEVSILSKLDQKHDNIIKLYGISIQDDSIKMVTEYAGHGSLLEKLQKGSFRSVSLLCQFAVQIASGMMYLEQKGLVHRDLAARNILVTAHNQVKISDFGLAKLVGKDNQWIMTAVEALPIRWLALESLLEGKFTSSSDVWSFGVVLWEMFSYGEHPWALFNSKGVIEKLKNGERLPEPQYCPSNVYSIVMRRCWAENPNERIKFEEARDNLICIHPTSSFAVSSSQEGGERLSYSVGDAIIALKPIAGNPDLWIGQNEKTLEFGSYIKSETQPCQTKIPFSSNSSLPVVNGKQSDSSKLQPGERSKSSATSGNMAISTPIEISNSEAGAHGRIQPRSTPPARSPPVASSPPTSLIGRSSPSGGAIPQNTPQLASPTAHSAGASRPDSGQTAKSSAAAKNNQDVKFSYDPSLPTRNGRANSVHASCFSVKEEITESTQGTSEMKSTRRTSLPIPDKLASGTAKRYPYFLDKLKHISLSSLSGDEEASNDLRSDVRKPDLPPKSSNSNIKDKTLVAQIVNNSQDCDDVESRTRGDTVNGLDGKEKVVKVRPRKPPRVSKGFYFDDSILQAECDSEHLTTEVLNELYENSGVFDLDPSRWVEADAMSHKDVSASVGNQLSFSPLAKTDVDHLGSSIQLLIPTVKQNSMKRVKKLRKTQSLESVGFYTAGQSTDDGNSLPVGAKACQVEANTGEKLEDPFSLSADAISYQKLENTSDDQVVKKRSLFGIKLKKKNRKERNSSGPPANLGSLFVEIEQALPDSTQPQIATALEVSNWNVEEAIKNLKIARLVHLNLCPQSVCEDILKTYNWDVLEASYAMKIHYLMAVHVDISLEFAAKLLRENSWDLEIVLNILKRPAFVAESEAIGFIPAEAERYLAAAENDFDMALRNMKVKTVADITQKPEDYCRTTLDHCQWKVDRAVTFILDSK